MGEQLYLEPLKSVPGRSISHYYHAINMLIKFGNELHDLLWYMKLRQLEIK